MVDDVRRILEDFAGKLVADGLVKDDVTPERMNAAIDAAVLAEETRRSEGGAVVGPFTTALALAKKPAPEAPPPRDYSNVGTNPQLVNITEATDISAEFEKIRAGGKPSLIALNFSAPENAANAEASVLAAKAVGFKRRVDTDPDLKGTPVAIIGLSEQGIYNIATSLKLKDVFDHFSTQAPTEGVAGELMALEAVAAEMQGNGPQGPGEPRGQLGGQLKQLGGPRTPQVEGSVR